jgi:vitamin B12 transporter
MFYVGERDDRGRDALGFPARVQLDPYFLVNTGLVFNCTRNLQLFGRIDNVFNEKYVEVFGYNVANASGYAGAAIRF